MRMTMLLLGSMGVSPSDEAARRAVTSTPEAWVSESRGRCVLIES
jgi:hypothetical protein